MHIIILLTLCLIIHYITITICKRKYKSNKSVLNRYHSSKK